MTATTPAATAVPVAVQDFLQYLQDSDVAVAVAVIKALTGVIYRSEATTMMQMEGELQEAAQQLKTCSFGQQGSALSNRYQDSIATTAGCELFLRFVTRSFLEFDVRRNRHNCGFVLEG
jgi:translation initiation factor eIF-2B subunit alpha